MIFNCFNAFSEEFVGPVPNPKIYNRNGLEIYEDGRTPDGVVTGEWNLKSNPNDGISIFTPSKKGHLLDEVKVLRNPKNGKVLAVSVEERVNGKANQQYQSDGIWGSLKNAYFSTVHPNQIGVTTYKLKNSMVVVDNAGKAEAVNKSICKDLLKNEKELKECASKIEKFTQTKPIVSSEDLAALRKISDDDEKVVTSSISSIVPKRIREAYSMCEELATYVNLDAEDIPVTNSVPVAPKTNANKPK